MYISEEVAMGTWMEKLTNGIKTCMMPVSASQRYKAAFGGGGCRGALLPQTFIA